MDARYLIEKELGRGGMGVVYLARDTKLNSRVVVKVLTDESYQDDYLKKKFHQEVEALVRLNHPGHPSVVQVLDQGIMSDGKPYFVMQFVEGRNLRSEIVVYPTGMDFKPHREDCARDWPRARLCS